MKILHYALGFPPYRTGGLTKFCIDLMQEQKKNNHEVAMLWPGEMKLVSKKIQIIKKREQIGIDSYELINPLPVSYDEGIIEIEKFTKKCDKAVFEKFFDKFKPDVIHIHTLMGLYKEFIEVAHDKNIKTVFTIHDFFSICPKVTLFRNGTVCKQAHDCGMCPQCNLTSLSLEKIFFLQSPLYRRIKNNGMIKKIRKKHRDNYLSGELSMSIANNKPIRKESDYLKLRSYYECMIATIDTIHANSNVTKDVFEQFYQHKNIKVISISHADIKDRRKKKIFNDDELKITYLGPGSEAKGFFLLKSALDDIWLYNKSFSLNLFFNPIEMSPYMIINEKYNYSELEKIFDSTDVLVCPSVLYETFGFTVLEALSCGVPVLVSGNVGAKDIIPSGAGIIIENIDKESLKNNLLNLTADVLIGMNKIVLEKMNIMTIKKTYNIIIEECY